METMHFRITGEYLTNIIRHSFVEGRLTIAKNLCEDSGAPESFWIGICTGKLKIVGDSSVGDGTLSIERDDAKEVCGISIDLDESIKRFEKKYAKLHIDFANAEARIRYYSLRCDADGIWYRNPKFSGCELSEYRMSADRNTVERHGHELAELEPLFSWLYPAIGKKAEEFDETEYIDPEDLWVPDLTHPYYIPNMKKTIESREPINAIPGKIIEEVAIGSLDVSDNAGNLIDAGKYINNKKEKNSKITMSAKTDVDGLLMEGRSLEWKKWNEAGGSVNNKDAYITLDIPTDVGDGTIMGCRGKKWYGKRNDDKTLRLSVTTFAGLSIGAMHHYGHLEGPYMSWYEMNEEGGYNKEFSSNVYDEPSWCKQVNIELTKPIEQWELDKYSDRFAGFSVGDASYAFWDIPSIVKKAKEVFKEKFEPLGWKLEIGEEYYLL